MSDKKIPLTNCNTWIRLAYMLLFTVLLMAARLVITLVVVVQFLLVLLIGSDNENLRNLGQGLAKWVYETVMFLTFNSQEKPFPFDEWPSVEATAGYSASNSEETEVEEVEDAEYIEAEDVADDDIPSFTSDESDADEDKDQPLK
jgi:hypothetical protein